MPQLIEAIDAIARRKQRDVLFVHYQELFFLPDETYAPHALFVAFLMKHRIPWAPCTGPRKAGSGEHLSGGPALIYLDVPYDLDNPRYQALAGYLETPEGQMRDPRVRFLCFPLAKALLLGASPSQGDGNGPYAPIEHEL